MPIVVGGGTIYKQMNVLFITLFFLGKYSFSFHTFWTWLIVLSVKKLILKLKMNLIRFKSV